MAYSKHWSEDFVRDVQKHGLRDFDLCLEIGCFEGKTSNFIADTMLSKSGKLVCIDPLLDEYYVVGKGEQEEQANKGEYKFFAGQYDRFCENCKDHMITGQIQLIRQDSVIALPALPRSSFDFIYVDGDHRQYVVFHDAVFSYQLLKAGGYLFFDDYGWSEGTKHAIDFFLDLYKNKVELLHMAGGNVIVKKLP